jgi:ubiquinone/menaquinone biosynthesis C-methylase UbiE
MLAVGAQARGEGPGRRVTLRDGDAEQLDLRGRERRRDHHGLRHPQRGRPPAALREMARVTRPGGASPSSS